MALHVYGYFPIVCRRKISSSWNEICVGAWKWASDGNLTPPVNRRRVILQFHEIQMLNIRFLKGKTPTTLGLSCGWWIVPVFGQRMVFFQPFWLKMLKQCKRLISERRQSIVFEDFHCSFNETIKIRLLTAHIFANISSSSSYGQFGCGPCWHILVKTNLT